MKPENIGLDSHSKVLDPIADEIIRIFKILQNDDGSWGAYENKLDRAFTTSWALQSMHDNNEKESLTKGIHFFKGVLEDIDYDVEKNFHKIQKERLLKGLFNVADILMESDEFKKGKLKKVYSHLLEKLNEKKWLSSTSVASYAIFGLRNQKLDKDHLESAEAFIVKEMKFQKKDLSAFTPDICLALPDTLIDFLDNPEEFVKKTKHLSDLKISHILIALSLLNEPENRIIINNIRSYALERLRKRQITEIDRKITKQFLDLTLLLRSGHRGASLKAKLKDLSPLMTMESESPEDVSFKVKLSRLISDFGELNIITLASYVLALSLLKEKEVYLLSSGQYDSIKEFFVHDTIPVGKRRELGFEIITLGVTGTLYVLSLFGLAYGIVELTKISTFLDIIKGNEWGTALTIVTIIFGAILWKTGLINCFPTIKGWIRKHVFGGK